MIKQRHPEILELLASQDGCSSVQALLRCADTLRQAELAEGRIEVHTADGDDPCQPRMGWQKQAVLESRNSQFRRGHMAQHGRRREGDGTVQDGAHDKYTIGQLPD